MSQSIEVNGKKVYSDKEVAYINDTRITFADGSWCDVLTGAVVNKGLGYISIGSPSEAAPSPVTVERTIQARNLRVNSLNADLEVTVHDLPHVFISITGPEQLVNAIEMGHEETSTAYITGPKGAARGNRGNRTSGISFNGGNGNIQIGDMTGGFVSVGGNSIFMGSKESEVKVTVKVPYAAALDITNVGGKTTIGDTDGDLTITSNVSGDIFVGRVKNTKVLIQASAEVKINEVTGNLNTTISGSGEVTVKKGSVVKLSVSISGSGEFNFLGTARTGDLSISGSGEIYVKNIVERPIRSVSGSGEIDIGNW